jgi:ketosteroid isomerase-like protein
VSAAAETESPAVAEVRAVIEALVRAHRTKDAETISRQYAPDARIADLSPPLMQRGMDREATQAWLDNWDGPVEVNQRDFEVLVDGGLAVGHGLEHVRTKSKAGEDAAWWSRATYVLGRTPAGWRITHAHFSVPFHMDGSYRAAVDLEP